MRRWGIYPVALIFLGIVQVQGWQANGVVICNATDRQDYPQAIPDGTGGGIIAWQDKRSGNFDIYVQRVDSSGVCQWDSNGVVVCDDTSGQFTPVLVSDGSGGAIITWYDYRNINPDIFAQRVDASGNIQWQANGVAVCDETHAQEYPRIISDGAGGAIVTWQDKRSGSYYDIYAQRIDSNGNPVWQANGIAICTASGNQENPEITSDGSGGAIITWQDGRGEYGYIVYAQRVSSLGYTVWQTNGVALSYNVIYSQVYPKVAQDGSGGAIVIWEDHRPGYTADIYGQRVNAYGTIQWDSGGLAICTAEGNQFDPVLVSSSSGGAIVTWWDFRSGSEYDIFAQSVDSSGNVLWDTNGVVVCNAGWHQKYPQIISDGVNGAIITWEDYRDVYSDIYVQRVDSLGVSLWDSNGVLICDATGDQRYAVITSNGSGGGLIAWGDERSGAYDIYAQWVDSTGTVVGVRTGDFHLRTQGSRLLAYPNPFRSSITIVGGACEIEISDLSGRILGRTKKGVWNGEKLKSGIYFLLAEGYEPLKLVKLK